MAIRARAEICHQSARSTASKTHEHPVPAKQDLSLAIGLPKSQFTHFIVKRGPLPRGLTMMSQLVQRRVDFVGYNVLFVAGVTEDYPQLLYRVSSMQNVLS